MSSNFIKPDLTLEEQIFLRKIARKNWAFFETFVGKDDNWLPIDNFQEHSVPKVAHRTSPTSIGLGLLSVLAAYDFGYITSNRLIELVTKTFTTMSLLERDRGHFYNWYDTQSLKALEPKYISTVDSGNLAASLLTLRAALRTLPDKNIVHARVFSGLQDTLTILNESVKDSSLMLADFQIELQSASQSAPALIESRACFERLRKCAGEILDSLDATAFGEAHWWAKVLSRECSDALLELDYESDHEIEELDKLSMRSLADFDGSSISSQRARADMVAIEKLIDLSSEFANLEYEFLLDETMESLVIGYHPSKEALDTARYDLLASEARLCYFVAIAQGLIPEECWFKLGRDLTLVDGQCVLLSWNGSMLEYVMPLLVMPIFDQTLLSQTYQSAVARQIEYGEECGVPWGISACCYNSIDDNQNYQYAAFGVPGLGLKRGLADDLVIAPHASALALLVSPEAALKNLQRLSSEGAIGRYGFYDAIDYTPERVPPGESHVVVRSFMAHHQGMTLLSISKLLLQSPMQNSFEAEPDFQAFMSLLQEPAPLPGKS